MLKSAKTTSYPLETTGKPVRAAERILNAARSLFYRQGIRAVGVDEIVREAGVTKPSLYRSFPSKDELAASYLRVYETEFWGRFDAAVAAYPEDPKAQILEFLSGVGKRTQVPAYRGCGLTNAAVEYPEPYHPARQVTLSHKTQLRERLRAMAQAMGATQPDSLGDGLLLLLEGAYISGQIFGPEGPASSIASAATRLIESFVEPK
jgi:AcrR family transcriptional regulator